MAIKDVIAKAMDKLRNRPVEVYGDNETRDKYLRSLRRERRIQLEHEEKKRLLAQIKAYRMKQQRQNLYGIGDNLLKTPNKFKKEKNNARWL